MSNDDFNDDLSDLLGGKGPVAAPKQPPASYIPLEKRFEEKCPKCNGRGRFISYAGRDCGPCFNCKGAGKKVFKTSPESRATARTQSAARSQQKAQSLLGEITQWQEQHAAAWQWLTSNVARGNEFAKSLTEALYKYGSLTDNQLAAVERQHAKTAARKAEREAAAPTVETAGIDRLTAAFDKAAAHTAAKATGLTVRNPKITISGLTISPAKATSKNPGALYVKSGEDYLGKIADGKFFATAACSSEQQAAVLKFVADPADAAKVYGQETGVCCVCNATLRSEWRLRGIGPICAEKFGW
jgi:hypothetical protein